MTDAVRDAVMARWPTLAAEWQSFVDASPDAPRDHLAERFLVSACVSGSARALRVLEAEYLSRVGELVRRIDSSPEFAVDVTQAVRARLLVPTEEGAVRLASYNGSVPLLGWLRVIAIRTALNHRRGARRTVGLEHAVTVGDGGEDVELARFRARHRDAFAKAFAGAVSALPAADATLLRLHYLDGLTLEAMATLHGVHRATIARRLALARRQVLSSTRDALAGALRLRASEIDSVVRLLKSDFDLSMSRLFKE
jgi:RNA polymerase sigma-70 factor (ECF subfamily)